jgi:hypothetical protein
MVLPKIRVAPVNETRSTVRQQPCFGFYRVRGAVASRENPDARPATRSRAADRANAPHCVETVRRNAAS